VLTLTAGNSDERKRVFRWGTQIDPFGVGVKGAWYVHAPGVHDIHLYIGFDGRMVQVAATQGATVTVAGALVGQGWHPVPVRTELRFGSASIAVTCEEAPVEAPVARHAASHPPAGSSPPAARASSPPGASPSPPAAIPLGPHTLMVTTPDNVEEMLAAEMSPLEPALPRSGTLRLMERGWAPPTPGQSPPVPAGSQPVGRNTPHVPVMAPPGIATAEPRSPAHNVAAQQPPAFVPQVQKPPVAFVSQAPQPPSPNAITQPPTVMAQGPVAPLRDVITKPSAAVVPQAQGLPPRDAHPAEQITQPPTAVPRVPSGHAPPIAPVARVTPPTTPMPEPHPLGAPQSEAVPTMADGGALRDHAKRLESLPRGSAEPATQEYFSAVRAYSGKSASDPPPNAAPPAPPPPPPFFSAAEMGKAPAEAAPPPEKPKGGFRQAWKETSLVKKAILFLLPFAAAGTLLQLEPEPEPVVAPPKVQKKAALKAATSAAKEVAPPASGASPAGSSNPAVAASGSASALEATSVAAASAAPSQPTSAPAASAAPAGALQAQAAEGKPSASALPNAVAASSATPPQPAGSAPVVAVGPASSAAVAAMAPGSTAAIQPENLELLHQALTATFAGNLPLATSLYAQLSKAQPSSQLFSLAARFTKEGAVRRP
jgi:hypothetical protein